MKLYALTALLFLLVSCSMPDQSSQTSQSSGTQTSYINEATGEEMTALQFMEGFKFGKDTYNVKEFSKVPEDVRVELRHNLSPQDFDSLPFQIQELLPLELIGTGMSQAELKQEDMELLQNMSFQDLLNTPLELRQSIASNLTTEELKNLPTNFQTLLTFEE
ncbi:MAG: hypothetical protein ACRCYY_10010 [Trueperaceae bacterium]